MIWIILLLSLVVLVADWAMYRLRIYPTACSRSIRGCYILLSLLSGTLPLLMSGIFYFFPDNPQITMDVALWGSFIYLITVLPRLVFYFFLLLRLRTLGILAAFALGLLFVWGVLSGRSTLVVNRIPICSKQLPAAFEGFRIVQFSDLHLGTLLHPAEELQQLVDTIHSLHPDLIVFSGDLVNIRYTELDSLAGHILGSLRAPYGVISTIGNHDIGYYIKDTLSLPRQENLARLIERQRQLGWRVLDNTSEYIVCGADSLSVSGISFDASLQQFRHSFELPDIDLSTVYRGVPCSMFNITVSHLPQLWPNITNLGYGELTLAGHVHSMQVKLRLFGRAFSPAQLLYDHWSGLYNNGQYHLYINDGIGSVGFPMRLGAPPEITLITLRR
ncbi:MAG: metallophosphoesterase [Alistipes sp.]